MADAEQRNSYNFYFFVYRYFDIEYCYRGVNAEAVRNVARRRYRIDTCVEKYLPKAGDLMLSFKICICEHENQVNQDDLNHLHVVS